MAAGAPPPSTKVDLVHLLAASRGYRHYLEICTPTTGTTYSSVDQSRFATSMRLMYRCPSDFEDGAPIDFRVPDDDVTPALAEMQRAGARFDVALVDSWHEYAPSWRDIVEVYARMMSGGAMVVHDCLPPVRIMASPFHRDEGWCGLSYKAFLDFVVDRTDLHYCTVDIDYGCGVIWKPPARRLWPNGRAPSGSESAVALPRRRGVRPRWATTGGPRPLISSAHSTCSRPGGRLCCSWSTPRASAPSSTSSSGRPIAG